MRQAQAALAALLLACLLPLCRADGCPNMCSSRGTCNPDQTCTCNTGFTLADCSAGLVAWGWALLRVAGCLGRHLGKRTPTPTHCATWLCVLL
jgi:hypothetical protein